MPPFPLIPSFKPTGAAGAKSARNIVRAKTKGRLRVVNLILVSIIFGRSRCSSVFWFDPWFQAVLTFPAGMTCFGKAPNQPGHATVILVTTWQRVEPTAREHATQIG